MTTVNTTPNIENQLVPILLGNGKEGLKHLLYYQIVTKAVPVVLKCVAGTLRGMLKRRMQKHIDHIAKLSVKTKTSSVILQRDYEKENDINMLFDAVLSYVSELPQTKHVKRTTTGVFIMASQDEIEISPCIYVRKLGEVLTTDKISKLTIEVYSYTYDLTTLRKYMEDIEERYKMAMSNQLGKNIFYFDEIPISLPLGLDRKPDLTKAPSRLMFSKYPLFTNKSLKNIYGDSVKIVRKRVDFFVNNKRWYEEKGVPYTLGLLLHGVPGAGKTSCIKSIAKDTNRHVLNIRLSESTTVNQLNALFYSSQVQVTHNGETKLFDIPIDKRIIVLEDIDCLTDVVLSRQNHDSRDNLNDDEKDTQGTSQNVGKNNQGVHHQLMQTQNQKLNLSILLNILDGVLEQPGRILIMTSNHPEKLDKALIRPGRIDVIVNFNYCKRHEVVEIIEAFTDAKIDKKDVSQLLDGVYTPAEVSRIIFENIENIPNIIKQLSVRTNDYDEEVVKPKFAPQSSVLNLLFKQENNINTDTETNEAEKQIEDISHQESPKVLEKKQIKEERFQSNIGSIELKGFGSFGIQPQKIQIDSGINSILASNNTPSDGQELSLDDFFGTTSYR